jgi:uncharacterized membrane protein
MIRYPLTYLATFVVMLAMDSVWLMLTGGPLYRAYLGDLLLDGFRPVPAVLFYVLYVAGIMVFVVPSDSVPSGSGPRRFGRIALFGALFGVVCYATYDLTNQATMKNWSTIVTVADIAWGAVLTAVGSTLGTLLGDRGTRLLRR